jgi:hypothetical protein
VAKMVKCSATIDNKEQLENLCECIRIIGGEPKVNKNTVSVKVPYESEAATKLIMLFEHYWRHEIKVSKK